ncbi:MAG: recombinase family protein [Phenylobacterium sp.]|uniref:recombinase family protein n=1 Tax=Phenylobacterium sp. TaxID=1871053 RepID=UPI003BB54D04
MRYGITVEGPHPPSAEVQRMLLESHGCDVVVEEPAMTPDARRRLLRLVARLKRGDELVVHGLEVLGQTTGALVHLLREVFRAGAAVVVAREAEQKVRFVPDANLTALIDALADHEAGQALPTRLRRRRGEAGRRMQLTAHQIEYARKLHAEGASPRAIGLLFQVAPDDLWQILDR